MKFRIKAVFFVLVLIAIPCLFSGCAWMSSSFDVELTGTNQTDIYVDMLLPFDTEDEFYTDYNENPENTYTPVPEKSCELAQYSENGYRSMYIHYNGSRLYQAVRDDASVCRRLFLPRELFDMDSTPYGEEAFMYFCDKYKKCRFAAFDDKGNILCVSKKVSLKKFPYYYINGEAEWDIEKNKIKPHYQISVDGLVINAFLSLCSVVCLIVQKILKAVYIRLYQKGNRNCPGILIASGICTAIPLIAILCWLPSILFMLKNFGVWAVIAVSLPIISLIAGIVDFNNFITDMKIFKKAEK